jgi:hypothetical protein
MITHRAGRGSLRKVSISYVSAIERTD